jgi:hypothetical protein
MVSLRNALPQSGARRCPVWVKSRHDALKPPCLLYPRKRTLVSAIEMSALCQKQTKCAAAKWALFDHLVGAREQHLTTSSNLVGCCTGRLARVLPEMPPVHGFKDVE